MKRFFTYRQRNLPRTNGLRCPVVEHERIKADVHFS